MSSPTTLHQALVSELLVRLNGIFRGSPCRALVSPLDVKLSEQDVVQPDLLVVCNPQQLRTHCIEGPPALVVEVLSPSTLRHDRVRKLNLYSQVGVDEYWLVTPYPFLFEVLHNVDGVFLHAGSYTEADVLRSRRFSELQLPLLELYESLPPQPPLDEVREGAPPYAFSGN
jgi:Uma2 family endonuclease